MVSAVISCMTPAEFPFVDATLDGVVPQVDQTIICIRDTFVDFEKERNLARFGNAEIKLLRIPFQPLGDVRNHGIAAATGEWVAFCDGDDIWCPGKIQRQLEQAAKYKAQFCGCDHMLMDDDGVVRLHALSRYIPMPSSWLVKREVMLQIPFDGTKYVEDGDWWRRSQDKIEKVRLPEARLHYRVRTGALSDLTGSKRRKTAFVNASQKPLQGLLLRAACSLAWRLTRSNRYVWKRDW